MKPYDEQYVEYLKWRRARIGGLIDEILPSGSRLSAAGRGKEQEREELAELAALQGARVHILERMRLETNKKPAAPKWLAAVKEEQTELQKRLAALREYNTTDALSPCYRTLLREQERAMSEYNAILLDRIAMAEKEHG